MIDWTTIITGVITLVLGAGGVKWYTVIKGEKRAGDNHRLSIYDQLQQDIKDLQTESTKNFKAAQAAERSAARAEMETAQVKAELSQLRMSISMMVTPILQWIDDGATPPPPVIPHELRLLLQRLEDQEVQSHV